MLLIHLLCHRRRVGGWLRKNSSDLQLISIGLIYFYNSLAGTLIRDGYNQKTGGKGRRWQEKIKRQGNFPLALALFGIAPCHCNIGMAGGHRFERNYKECMANATRYSGARVIKRLFTDARAIFCKVNMISPGRLGLDEHTIGAWYSGHLHGKRFHFSSANILFFAFRKTNQGEVAD